MKEIVFYDMHCLESFVSKNHCYFFVLFFNFYGIKDASKLVTLHLIKKELKYRELSKCLYFLDIESELKLLYA